MLPAQIHVPYRVPYAAQIASPELAWAYWEEGFDIAADPRWAETGAASTQEYAYWADRACGPACVKMCVEALGGASHPLMAWVRMGLTLNGYIVKEEATGRYVEIGWAHRALAILIQQAGFAAEAKAASPEDLVNHLRSGHLIIASVSPEVGTTAPVTKRGGHLVVISGAAVSGHTPLSFTIHNPSGRLPELQDNARVLASRFESAFSGRIIVVHQRFMANT